MFGRWTLGEENGDTCTVELQNFSWFGGYKAYMPAGCPKDFFSANRWVISGNRLLITDSDNRVVGSFSPAGPDRWSGRRASDGARLYLNRR
ncbi:AprI/Inh family metalloprotease inhibitor [Lysobacter cavernae]|uniref:AprI/Inh family metalloprotease inhibitor n=1 Tax=Lysobacter cavernae TaxID=1685901 RepID=A0ABV7RR44_9GAMM